MASAPSELRKNGKIYEDILVFLVAECITKGLLNSTYVKYQNHFDHGRRYNPRLYFRRNVEHNLHNFS